MALRTSSSTSDTSAISPLRTPRERAWPRPMRFSEPAAFTSPTAAQTFEVPISNPTMRDAGSNISFNVVALRTSDSGNGGGHRAGVHPFGGNIVGNREVQRGDGLVHPL